MGTELVADMNNNKGFTMVEMLVVVILIGLISAIVFSRSYQSNAGLVGEVALLKSQLRYVQSLAMADNTKSWGLKIENGKYTLMENAVASGSNLPNEPTSERIIPSQTNVSIPTVTPNDTITFDEWGSPGSQNYSITLSDGSNPDQTITVTKNTGFIQ